MPLADFEVYAEALLRGKHGFPFWLTEPHANLPSKYRGGGVQIGDVLVLTPDGGYDFIFNIFLPKEDDINRGRAPENFVPLTLQAHMDVTTRPDWKNSGSQISNTKAKQITLNANASLPVGIPLEFGGGFEFKMCSSSGGILVIPEGASRSDYVNHNRLRDYIDSNIEDWFDHVNGPLFGRNTRSLYIVTGCDKSTESAVASYTHSASPETPEREISLKFTAGNTSFGASYSWSSHTSASVRVTPVHFQDDGSKSQNQCIFARGFMYTQNQRAFRRGTKVKIGDLSKTKPWRMSQQWGFGSFRSRRSSSGSSSSASPPLASPPSSTLSYPAPSPPLAPTASYANLSQFFPPFSENSDTESDPELDELSKLTWPQNPSEIINTRILQFEDDFDYFVTHDEEWCSLQPSENSNALCDPSALLEEIALQRYNEIDDESDFVNVDDDPEDQQLAPVRSASLTTFDDLPVALLGDWNLPVSVPSTFKPHKATIPYNSLDNNQDEPRKAKRDVVPLVTLDFMTTPAVRPNAVKRLLSRSPSPEPQHVPSIASDRPPPDMSCFFCRHRKIACGQPSADSEDRTCNQCRRRSLKCEYPLESRRGMGKKRKTISDSG